MNVQENMDKSPQEKMGILHGLPPEEKGLSKKRKLQILGSALLAVFLIILLFLFMGKGKTGGSAKIQAVNRGLVSAEGLRRQRDLFGSKDSPSELGPKETGSKEGGEDSSISAIRPEKKSEGPSGSGSHGIEGRNPPNPFGGILHGLGNRSSEASLHQEENGDGAKDMGMETGGDGSHVLSHPVDKEYKPQGDLYSRMSDEYQKALAFNASEQLVFTKERGAQGGKSEDEKGGGTTEFSPRRITKVVVSAGQEMTAVLNEALDSDYPSVAKATITSPFELHGASVLVSYALQNERVSAQVQKLVLPPKDGEKGREMTIAAVVKSGLPGLPGDVNHHFTSQLIAGLASAGLTAGALAYGTGKTDVGTAVLLAPVVEQGVAGVTKPINYLGRDRPITVSVPAGTEFTLLVTDGFEVEM